MQIFKKLGGWGILSLLVFCIMIVYANRDKKEGFESKRQRRKNKRREIIREARAKNPNITREELQAIVSEEMKKQKW